MESRIVDLEIRLTHLEASLEELTHSVLRQERVVRHLTAELEEVRMILRELAGSPVLPASHETPPPHY